MDSVALDLGKKSLFWTYPNRISRNLRVDSFLVMMIGCMFIAIVSAYDTYLVTIEEQILYMEKNPICTSLIRLDPSGFTYFIIGKAMGTAVVVTALMFFHRIRYSYTSLVTGSVVAFQAMLLVYLHLSDPLLGGLPNFELLFNG